MKLVERGFTFSLQSVREALGPYPTKHPPPPLIFIFACGNLQIIINQSEINTFQRESARKRTYMNLQIITCVCTSKRTLHLVRWMLCVQP